jgi:uncharacterized coiled-coil protein SlyX
MGDTFKLTEITLSASSDIESPKTTLTSTVRRRTRNLTAAEATLSRVSSLPSIFKGIKLSKPHSQPRSIASTPKAVLPRVNSKATLASKFLPSSHPNESLIDSIRQSVLGEIDELFNSKSSAISHKISKLEEKPEIVAYFNSLYEDLADQKARYDKLHYVRRHKERQLKELMWQVLPSNFKEMPIDLQTSQDSVEKALKERLKLIENEESLMLTYDQMRRTRTDELKDVANKTRALKGKVHEVCLQVHEHQNKNKLVDKELERLLKKESRERQLLRSLRSKREEQVKAELMRFKGSLEIEAFTTKTRTRREDELRLKGQERKLDLLEQAYSNARKSEVLKLELQSQQMKEADCEAEFNELNRVTHADSAEMVVHQYEEVARRRGELEQLSVHHEAEVEAKKAELTEMRALKDEKASPLSEGARNLVELETRVVNEEAALSLKEADMERLNATAANVTSAVEALYASLRQLTAGLEDTKASKLDEVYRRLDAIMQIVDTLN